MFNQVITSLIAIFNENAYINIVINNTLKNYSFNENEKKLYTKLVYGVVENKLLIDYRLQPLIKGQRVKPYIKNALRIGVYGLDFLNIAKHYLVDSLVQTVKHKDYKASTFVNAILRKYEQTPTRTLEGLSNIDYYSIKYSIEKPIATLLYQQYHDQINEFFKDELVNYNTYRINTLKTNQLIVSKYLDELNINYLIEDDIILQTKESLINTSLFKNGLIVAQDKSSIKVGLVCDPKPNTRILDACSAPGSKAMHLASIIENQGFITALDIYDHKINLINENKDKLNVTCVNAYQSDARYATFDEPFDLILADVPCSGLGVIRHKPDLKYQMTIEKINEIKKLQNDIVENVIKYLKKGGILVYSTCTINQEENQLFIESFLKKHPNFSKIEEILTLPSNKEDGFYICKLRG